MVINKALFEFQTKFVEIVRFILQRKMFFFAFEAGLLSQSKVRFFFVVLMSRQGHGVWFCISEILNLPDVNFILRERKCGIVKTES